MEFPLGLEGGVVQSKKSSMRWVGIFSRTTYFPSLTFAPSVSTSPFNLEDPERNQKQELISIPGRWNYKIKPPKTLLEGKKIILREIYVSNVLNITLLNNFQNENKSDLHIARKL